MNLVRPLQVGDKPMWLVLAKGYKAFYETSVTDAEYDAVFINLLNNTGVHALVVEREGQVVGFAHFLMHQTIWAPCACYLQDLFVPLEQRGKGIARALIEAVADRARDAGANRYYWTTKVDNATARALYDKVAEYRGFVRYDYSL